MRAGLAVELTISAQVHSADDDLLDLPENRDCLFEDELPVNRDPDQVTLFQKYHSKNCVYECALTKTQKEFSCTPWDIPAIFEVGETRLCQGEEADRFKAMLHAVNCEGECPPSCNTMVYETAVGQIDQVRPTYFKAVCSQVNSFETDADVRCTDGEIFKHLQVNQSSHLFI